MSGGAPLRILHLSHTLSMGGGEYHLVQHAKGLKQRGHEVRVACRAGNMHLRNALESAGVDAVPIPAVPSLMVPGALARVLRDQCQSWKPDLVCANTLTTAAVAAFLKRTIGPKLVYAVMVIRHDRRLTPLLRLIYRQLDGVMYNSRYTQDSYHAILSYQVPELVNFSTVEDPRDKLYDAAARSGLRNALLSSGKRLVGFVGRIHPEKGVMDFLQMAEMLYRGDSSIRFVLIGAKDKKFQRYGDDAENFARERLGHAATFLGHVDNPASHIAVMDCLVNPTYGEGFGRVALEAVYLGTPIVATEPGGMTEILAGYSKARMVPWHRPDLMANAVGELMSSNPYSEARGADAKAAAQFDHATLVDKELAFFRRVIRGDGKD